LLKLKILKASSSLRVKGQRGQGFSFKKAKGFKYVSVLFLNFTNIRLKDL